MANAHTIAVFNKTIKVLCDKNILLINLRKHYIGACTPIAICIHLMLDVFKNNNIVSHDMLEINGYDESTITNAAKHLSSILECWIELGRCDPY